MNINGIEEEVKHVKVNKNKRNIFCITTNISEVLKMKSDTIIIPSSNRYKKNMNIVDEISDDDVVLIFYASIAPKIVYITWILMLLSRDTCCFF